MADRRQLLIGKALVHEQANLLDILLAHVFPKRLSNGVGTGFGNSRENETMLVRDDHRAQCRYAVAESSSSKSGGSDGVPWQTRREETVNDEPASNTPACIRKDRVKRHAGFTMG